MKLAASSNERTELFFDKDTIVAQATPSGRGGVAILRLSGPLVKHILEQIISENLKPRYAKYTSFLDQTGEMLDQGIALLFEAPDSFTGEDVLELHCHGSPIILDLLLKRILQLGARLARPGEFSERAFLNNKMDLTQAEAVADLIDAASEQAARSALRSLKGAFSKAVNHIVAEVIQLRVYVEAAIDFSDEEIDFLSQQKLLAKLDHIVEQITHLQKDAQQGIFLREGLTVVLAGEPNVGKSSLLNCLSGEATAIVTDVPGTTRDVLRENILIDGIPIKIIDTAGLRESDDVVEREGIRRALTEIKQADILLYLFDASKNTVIDYDTLKIERQCPVILLRNKIDLLDEAPTLEHFPGHCLLSISAQTGAGIDLLKAQIKTLIGFQVEGTGCFLARRRHLEALIKAKTHLENGELQLRSRVGLEIAAFELRLAQEALNEITGQFTSDDLLGQIFSSFCIGK